MPGVQASRYLLGRRALPPLDAAQVSRVDAAHPPGQLGDRLPVGQSLLLHLAGEVTCHPVTHRARHGNNRATPSHGCHRVLHIV